MIWIRAFGWLPVPVFYTDWLPKSRGGIALGPVALIRPKYRNDEGITRHELVHVEQFYILWIMLAVAGAPLALWWFSDWTVVAKVVGLCVLGFPVLYLTSRSFRLAAEAAAYREQMCWPNSAGGYLSINKAAEFLTNRYWLGISMDEARASLQ